MTIEELQRVLNTLPSGSFDVIIRGRELAFYSDGCPKKRKPVITASIPDGSIPEGWKPAAEPAIQHVPGSRRVRWEG